MLRPPDLFNRTYEWRRLDEFVRLSGSGVRLGVVYGRRRQGKSYLLRRLVGAGGGAYVMPLEEARAPALQHFADGVGAMLGLPTGQLTFTSWDEAMRAAMAALVRTGRRARPPTLVIDELPYLLAHSPEIPSVLQRLYDEARQRADSPPVRFILCGSALSVMTDLLSGTRAMRGRAMIDLCLKPFAYREATRFWGITNPNVALHVHAIFGGTPGYRDLIASPPPARVSGLGDWLAGSVLNPAHALFSEADYLLREDPRLTDRALYHSVLTAIAGGANTPSQIGAAVGRPAQSLGHAMSVLRSAGFVDRIDDVLLQRRPRLLLADPIVRFHQLIVAPRLPMLEEHRAAEAWGGSAETFSANILGPHFEQIARLWTMSHGASEGLHHAVGAVGPTVVNDPRGRTQHEIDVVGLAEGNAIQARNPRVVVLGEAKHSTRRRTPADLERMERLRALLVTRGVDAANAQLVLFSRVGADAALTRLAAGRSDVLLVDLATLFGLQGPR